MKLIKLMTCAALVAACVAGISGCNSKSAKDYSKPKVAEGAIAAIALRPMENTSLSALCKQYGLGMADLMKQAPDEKVQAVIKDLELDKAQTKWLAVTVDALSADKIEKGEPDFAVAIATTVDLDKAVAVCEKNNKEKAEFKKTTIAGVPAYEAVGSEKKSEAFMANLDKQLILVASTSAGLEKQIALYRDGKGASADFGSFALGANDILRVKVAKVGENVKKSVPDLSMLQGLNGFVPDADKLVLGLGTVELALSASDDGKDAKFDLTVETASDADADKLRTLAKSGLMPLTAMVKDAKDEGMKLASGVLQATKIAGEGKVASLSVAYAADNLIKFVSEQKKNVLK